MHKFYNFLNRGHYGKKNMIYYLLTFEIKIKLLKISI